MDAVAQEYGYECRDTQVSFVCNGIAFAISKRGYGLRDKSWLQQDCAAH